MRGGLEAYSYYRVPFARSFIVFDFIFFRSATGEMKYTHNRDDDDDDDIGKSSSAFAWPDRHAATIQCTVYRTC